MYDGGLWEGIALDGSTTIYDLHTGVSVVEVGEVRFCFVAFIDTLCQSVWTHE